MPHESYVDFDPKQGWPCAADLFYECMRCHKVLPSMPNDNLWCDCYNLCIDVDAVRLGAEDESSIKLIRRRE